MLTQVSNQVIQTPYKKNVIINGNFDIWQRGTSFSNINSFNADRWRASTGTAGTVTKTAFTPGQTSVPGEPESYMSINKTGTGDYLILYQRVENVRSVAGQPFTLSFYAKASITTTLNTRYGQNFGSGGSSDNYTGVVSHTLTTSWQKFTVDFTPTSLSGKTIGAGSFFEIDFLPGASSASWVGTFDLSRVQLELGSVATPFEYRPFAEELALCQRYYEKSFPIGTAPAQNAGTAGSFTYPQVVGASSAQNYMSCPFKVKKRADPTCVTYNPLAANAEMRNLSVAADCSSTAVNSALADDNSIVISMTTPAGSAAGQGLSLHWTADAEL